MTPRALDVGTDEGIVNAIGVAASFIFALGIWAGFGLGVKWKRRVSR